LPDSEQKCILKEEFPKLDENIDVVYLLNKLNQIKEIEQIEPIDS
jgi:hypothetical protein